MNHYTIEASYQTGQIFHVESYYVLLFSEVKIEMPVIKSIFLFYYLFRMLSGYNHGVDSSGYACSVLKFVVACDLKHFKNTYLGIVIIKNLKK